MRVSVLVEGEPGEAVGDVAQKAVALKALLPVPMVMVFNDTRVGLYPNDTRERLVQRWVDRHAANQARAERIRG